MENRSIVDQGQTVQNSKDTTKATVVMHALTGADTVTTTDNVSIAGDPRADLDEVCRSAMLMRKVCLQECNLRV